MYALTFFFQKMRELILTSSLKVRMEAENDMLTKTLGGWNCLAVYRLALVSRKLNKEINSLSF